MEMLDRWSKIATIALAVILVLSAVVGPTIGGVVWLAQMNYDVKGLQVDMDKARSEIGQLQMDVGQLQTDFQQLKTDVQQLQTDVQQIQESQRAILDILERIENGAASQADGPAQSSQTSLAPAEEQDGR